VARACHGQFSERSSHRAGEPTVPGGRRQGRAAKEGSTMSCRRVVGGSSFRWTLLLAPLFLSLQKVGTRRRPITSGLLSHNPRTRSHDLLSSVSKGAQRPKKLPFVRFPSTTSTLKRGTPRPHDAHRSARRGGGAVRPLARRQLGRTEHARIIAESGSSLYDLLDHLPGGARR